MVDYDIKDPSLRSFDSPMRNKEEWKSARTLDDDARREALEAIDDWHREHVYILPMFDLFAIYGINPKLRGFEEPRFDKNTFANLWNFASKFRVLRHDIYPKQIMCHRYRSFIIFCRLFYQQTTARMILGIDMSHY